MYPLQYRCSRPWDGVQHLHECTISARRGVRVQREGGNHCGPTTVSVPPRTPTASLAAAGSLIVRFNLLSGERDPGRTWLARWHPSGRTPGNFSRICPALVNPSRCWRAEEMPKVTFTQPEFHYRTALSLTLWSVRTTESWTQISPRVSAVVLKRRYTNCVCFHGAVRTQNQEQFGQLVWTPDNDFSHFYRL